MRVQHRLAPPPPATGHRPGTSTPSASPTRTTPWSASPSSAGRSPRLLDDGLTLEVTRVATDGTRNACSMLYAAA
ncbi:hypothetical protein [Rhizomonospora bruguierae]|uniref:hypothetical protein n=1 Tax=Rhizomonospora bruguierae TaxID=1581705 RepID=UPI0020C08A83|nr:hypothetical protein [Micromonospora sp. NBRC 107566]